MSRSLAALVLVGCLVGCVVGFEKIDPSTWSYNTGYTYTLYSYASYCSNKSIESWDCLWCQYNSTVSGFKPSNIFFADGELAFTGINPDYNQIVVAFRGSSNIVNWLNDFDATEVPYPFCKNCKVHEGFYNTWGSLKTQIVKEVQILNRDYPTYDIVVTGHSLGAAVATVSSPEIKMNVSASTNVYLWNLGSPRVGNPDYANWVATEADLSHIQRMVNWKDIVPHTPNESQFYHHVPQEAWEQKEPAQWEVCSATNGEDPTCSDSVKVPSVADHTLYFGLDLSTPCD